MIYRQSNAHLKYEAYPLSAHTERYDPQDGSARKRFTDENGVSCFRFCALHNHLAMELILIEEGDLEVSTALGKITAGKGDVLVFNPFEVHACITKKTETPSQYAVVNFDLSMLRCRGSAVLDPMLDGLGNGDLRFVTHLPHNLDVAEAVGSHVREIMRQYGDRGDPPTAFLNIMQHLFGALSAFCAAGMLMRADEQTLSREVLFSQKVVRYVTEHYTEPLSTEQIARHLHFNKSYFCRMFRGVFGQSFGEYLNEFRISIARSLSAREFHNLSALSESVGYQNYTVFAKQFQKLTGHTPREYYHSASIIAH